MVSDAVWVAISCLITLTVSFIFNWVVSSPKRKRQEKEEADQKRQAELSEIYAKIAECKSAIDKRFDEQQEIMEEQKKYTVKRLDEQSRNIKYVMSGLQAELKNNLKVRYQKWIDLGYAPLDAKEDLERMYQSYHKLGANGIMDKMREEFLNLPNSNDD